MRKLLADSCGRAGDCARVSGAEGRELSAAQIESTESNQKSIHLFDDFAVFFQTFPHAILGRFFSVSDKVLPIIHTTYKNNKNLNMYFYYLNRGTS